MIRFINHCPTPQLKLLPSFDSTLYFNKILEASSLKYTYLNSLWRRCRYLYLPFLNSTDWSFVNPLCIENSAIYWTSLLGEHVPAIPHLKQSHPIFNNLKYHFMYSSSQPFAGNLIGFCGFCIDSLLRITEDFSFGMTVSTYE